MLGMISTTRGKPSAGRLRQMLAAVITSAHVSTRQHTSAYVSIRQHTSAYVSIRQHTLAAKEGEYVRRQLQLIKESSN
jgi:hypothetical protein